MCFDGCACAACVGPGLISGNIEMWLEYWGGRGGSSGLSPHDSDRALGLVPLPKPEPVKPAEIPARALRYGPGTAPLIPHE